MLAFQDSLLVGEDFFLPLPLGRRAGMRGRWDGAEGVCPDRGASGWLFPRVATDALCGGPSEATDAGSYLLGRGVVAIARGDGRWPKRYWTRWRPADWRGGVAPTSGRPIARSAVAPARSRHRSAMRCAATVEVARWGSYAPQTALFRQALNCFSCSRICGSLASR
jgi:hypothetical protein